MNKLEILISARLADLEASTESQNWKYCAYADSTSSADKYCLDKSIEYSDKATIIIKFVRDLLGDKYTERNHRSDAVVLDPRMTVAVSVWYDAYLKAKKSADAWDLAHTSD